MRSWLLDLLVKALEEDPDLEDVSGYTADSGEGRWTVEEAIALAVPMPVISASLFARFASRQDDSPTMKAVAALRNQFGGHEVMGVEEGRALRRGEAPKDVKAVRKTTRRAERPTRAPPRRPVQGAGRPPRPGRPRVRARRRDLLTQYCVQRRPPTRREGPPRD